MTHWSPFPREDYCVAVPGTDLRVGIGLYNGFDLVPGAWNLLWLTSNVLDDLVPYRGEFEKFPMFTDITAVCVATALQPFDYAVPTYTIGHLTLETTPAEFIDKIRDHKEFLLGRLCGQPWFNVATLRAGMYRPKKHNAKVLPFRRRA